jgi:hypothetical protein
MSDFIDAVTNTDDVDDYDTLLDMLDALEHESGGETGRAAAIFAARILDCVADLSVTERALLSTAIEKAKTREGWESALAAFRLLYLRVRERAPSF